MWHGLYPSLEFILNYIESGDMPGATKYLLYLDSFDSLLVGDASRVDRAFESYDARFVAMASRNDWPPTPELA